MLGRGWWVLGGSFLAAFGLVVWLVAGGAPGAADVLAFDRAASAAARDLGDGNPAWVAAVRGVTRLGDAAVVTVLAVLAVAALLVLRRFEAALVVVAGLVLARLVSHAVRTAVARTRPTDGFDTLTSWSFPSGHTVNATAAATLLVVVLWPYARPGARRVGLVAAGIGWAVAAGLSRVALVVHWPTDVLAGWLLTGGTVILTAATISLLWPRRWRPAGTEPATDVVTANGTADPSWPRP